MKKLYYILDARARKNIQNAEILFTGTLEECINHVNYPGKFPGGMICDKLEKSQYCDKIECHYSQKHGFLKLTYDAICDIRLKWKMSEENNFEIITNKIIDIKF